MRKQVPATWWFITHLQERRKKGPGLSSWSRADREREEPCARRSHATLSYGYILEKVSGSRQDSERSRGRETVLKCLLNVAENND